MEAFGNKATTIKRLKSGSSNGSDIEGAVLQRNNIHIAVCAEGEVTNTLTALKASPATAKAKAKFVLATDGATLEAEDLATGETVVCDYQDFPNHFGFFLPLAGISTVKQIRESSFDIRATSRLNRLYVELLRHNPEWGTAERRHDMNHFMARLIFCFFAEDTDIFNGNNLFTATIEQMSARDSSNTHEVIGEIFRAMNTKLSDRKDAGIRSWADGFPYVNGGLFSGSTDAPHLTKIARSYLLHVGSLDWKQINPDIFGSMIQAVADDDERGSLGMHYTSVPNILKVLNPLFLDDLREQLEQAGDNPRKLLNLRKRMANIRVFDPACGSGNFLVIAYKQMREIEAEINQRRQEATRATDIPLTNFRGIELRDFPAEVARLALIIAEYQCDVLYRGQQDALAEFLPLDSQNWITCGNALRLDWLSVCPPTGTGVKLTSDDLFETPLNQVQIDFENEGGETYICGNPPYIGDKKQNKNQKSDIEIIFSGLTKSWKSLDYICGFFYKAFKFFSCVDGSGAFVSTNSVVQGQHVPRFWGLVIDSVEIFFAVQSFKWSNLASNKAGVTCVVIGFRSRGLKGPKFIYEESQVKNVENISPYLIEGRDIIIKPSSKSISSLSKMTLGNVPKDDGGLLLSAGELEELGLSPDQKKKWIKKALGSTEYIQGKLRFCLWLSDEEKDKAIENINIRKRISHVKSFRDSSVDSGMAPMARRPHQFREMNVPSEAAIIIPRVSSENREFLPAGLIGSDSIITDRNYAIYDKPLWNLSLVLSKLHWVWIGAVCVRMRTDFSYSNTLGWNTFPVPKLTEKNKQDLTRRAEEILLARESHFPATIADLYNPEKMPDNLRQAHERNDEVLERIYIGRRFKNDTERLEKLFELYTKMTNLARSSSGGET
ncbi:lactate dehydrogenase [Gilvimarinus sp. SDUM040013]|nr:DNA methyltransferase [Gilvimarinus sp. SDUM040013]MDO3384924.1 lactate dehydrogenase [Gilvimarinus sp. SDUM040013]